MGLQDHKSSEHNLDVYALFRLLARRTGDARWNAWADHAWDFVRAVWNEADGFFLTLRGRDQAGDRAAAADLLAQIRSAQHNLSQGQTFGGTPGTGGSVAASSPMDTGFGFGYFPNLHVAATSWYVFAANRFNPYRFN